MLLLEPLLELLFEDDDEEELLFLEALFDEDEELPFLAALFVAPPLEEALLAPPFLAALFVVPFDALFEELFAAPLEELLPAAFFAVAMLF